MIPSIDNFETFSFRLRHRAAVLASKDASAVDINDHHVNI
jgi:hypothetical protein